MPGRHFSCDSSTSTGAAFQTTSWTDLRALAGSDPVRQREALERICSVCWKPIYAYIRRRGFPRDQAKDLTQDFFYHLLRKERLKLADRRRGRFRSFVLKSLQNFLASDWDRRSAQKRDERVVVSLDETFDGGEPKLEPVGGEPPDRAFEKDWARQLFGSVRLQLETALRSDGKSHLLRLLPVALNEESDSPYASLATELGMTESSVKKAIERLRSRWRGVLAKEISTTVLAPEEVDEELRYLTSLVAR